MTAGELRAVARLGRRTARREWKRTTLITLLVAIPVAASLVVAGVVAANEIPPEVSTAATFGAADVRIESAAPADSPAAPAVHDWIAETVADLAPDAQVLAYRHGFTPAGYGVVDLELTSELADGILTPWEGQLPTSDGEVAVSPRLLDRLGGAVGGTAEVGGHELTIVGIVVDPVEYNREVAVVTSRQLDRFEGEARDGYLSTIWLVGGIEEPHGFVDRFDRAWEAQRSSFLPEPAVTPKPAALASVDDDLYATLDADQVAELVDLAAVLTGDELVDAAWSMGGELLAIGDPWASARELEGAMAMLGRPTDRLMAPGTIATFVAGVLLAEVALVAGAAYATGARRRLRELGLLGANGATAWHVRIALLGEAFVAGVLGAAFGILLGVVALLAGKPLLQPLVSRYLSGLPLTTGSIVGPAIVGVLAILAAAWVPARNAAGVSPITALQGRMPLSSPPRWLAPGGVALAGFGILITTVALAAGQGRSSAMLSVVGVVLTITGTALLTPPIVAALGRVADRLPATWRLVVRDSTRQRTRAAAATAAAMVLLMAPVLIGFGLASEEAQRRVNGLPDPVDHVTVSPPEWMVDRPAPRAVRAASELGDHDAAAENVAGLLPDATRTVVPLLPLTATPATAPQVEGTGAETAVIYGWPSGSERISAGIGTGDVVDALGDERVGEALRAGVPVVLGIEERDTSVTLDDGTVLAAREVPVPVLWSFPRLLLPPGTAESLGVWASMELTLFTDVSLTRDLERDLWQAGDGAAVAMGDRTMSPATVRWLAVGAALLVALVVLGLVTALSTTESDHDLRTMVAVGAAPRLRRRFLAMQTGYHAVIGALLAVPLAAGLYWAVIRGDVWHVVGPFGLHLSNELIVPWLVLLAVVAGVPLVIAGLTATMFRSAPTVPPRRLG